MNKETLRKEYRVFQIIMVLIICLMLALVTMTALFLSGAFGELVLVFTFSVLIGFYGMRSLKREYKKKVANYESRRLN